jgi:hypothetical protein
MGKNNQTGQRQYNPQDAFDTDLMDEYRRMSAQGQVPSDLISPDEIMKQAMRDLGSSVAGQAGGSVGAALVDPYYSGMSNISKVGEGLKNTFSLNPTASASNLSRLSDDLSPLGDDLVILPSLSTESAAANVGQANLETFKTLKDSGSLTNVGSVKNPVFAMDKAQASKLNEMSSTNAPVSLKSGETGSLKTDPTQQITSTSQAVAEGGSYASGVKGRLDWSTPEGANNFASSAGAAGTIFYS